MIPISDILIRSISGYVFMVPVFVLYFLWLKKLGRTQSFLHTAAVFEYYSVCPVGIFPAAAVQEISSHEDGCIDWLSVFFGC